MKGKDRQEEKEIGARVQPCQLIVTDPHTPPCRPLSCVRVKAQRREVEAAPVLALIRATPLSKRRRGLLGHNSHGKRLR